MITEDENETEFKSKQRKPSFAKTEFVKSNEHVKTPRESVKKVENKKQAKYPRKNSQSPRGTMTGWKKQVLPLSYGRKLMRGFVAFGGDPKGGRITGKGKISTGKLDFEDVYFVKELKFNLFSVSQMCDKKNSVLFTDTECVVLSPDFKLLDENHVLLRVPRKDNMYSVDLKNIVPLGGLTCLFAKATLDESNLWHRRLGHINFKTLNKLVRGNLVRGLPLKIFENNHTCVACQKGKQHKASCKTKTDENCEKNQINHKVKIIRCDNGTEFKNNDMNQFNGMKGIKREFSVARTPQQNGVNERKNRTLIEAARTMLADSLLPTTFWAKAVSTVCYVQNRVLVTKPHNKTPYELFHGRPPSISFMRPFGCPVTILNNLDPLGKFDGKADEGLFVGYSINSKAFRVFNTRTRKVEENLHITFLENKPNVARSGSYSLFDIDLLTNSMSYEPVTAGNQTNKNEVADDAGKKTNEELANEGYVNNTNRVSTVSLFFSAAGESFTNADDLPTDLLMPDLEDTANLLNTGIFSGAYDDEDEGAEADLNNLETTMNVSPILTTRIHKDHRKDQIIGDINSATQIRRMTKIYKQLAMKVLRLVDLPKGKHTIGTKWVYRNKKDERGIVVRNKARMVAQRYTQEEGIDYDELFAPVARIEAIRLFFAYASFMGFIVYQMDVKSAFLYGTIEEEVYVCQPPGFEDPQFPDKVYMVMQRDDGIFISQDKYVADILKKFVFVTMKITSTPIETNKALLKDKEAEDVDVHLYRLMIRSLMYLTTSRLDIMFVVCACASDYAGASLDRKSTIGGVMDPNQMLDYGFNFMNTKIYIDNESTICIMKNLVFHSKTKHIELRHHFIRDSYKKKLIQVIKIYTDHNVANLLTKAFDVSSGPIPLVTDETVIKEWENKMEKAATTASSLEAEYVLTKSPTIYVSLIEQFWQTASASTLENGDIGITAIIDGKVKVVSEASIRRHLKLEDSDAINTLPTSEIFK
ncbi:ribonuclease H-like domain-containing protein [Tanacetum coccineum]